MAEAEDSTPERHRRGRKRFDVTRWLRCMASIELDHPGSSVLALAKAAAVSIDAGRGPAQSEGALVTLLRQRWKSESEKWIQAGRAKRLWRRRSARSVVRLAPESDARVARWLAENEPALRADPAIWPGYKHPLRATRKQNEQFRAFCRALGLRP